MGRPTEMGERGMIIKNKQNNIVHAGKATDWQRSMAREELCIDHTEFCLPKEI